ncbi:MAG: hypothetical protein ABSG69_02460 [Candidatus Acidiferrum sp.]|jgi:hypothetical protein
MMKRKVDIFKKLPDGQMAWVRSVDGMEEARLQLKRLEYINPGEYFIYDFRFGGIIPSLATETYVVLH